MLLAGVGILCLANAACALDPAKAMSQYIHQRWGPGNGFLGGSVLAISQSNDGYLWIGTERGLVRFDGNDFILIQQPIPTSPRIGSVRGLALDRDGNLWIRLDDSRLLMYRDGRFEDAIARFNLQADTFTAMFLDHDGAVLLSGLGHRILRWRNGKFETIIPAPEVGTMISLAETRDHEVWMGTRNNGLFRTIDGQFSRVSRELANAKINTLLAVNTGGLSSGGVWIGTDHGILFWDGTKLASTGLPAAIGQLQVLALLRDHDGNIWAGTDHGLVRITPQGDVSLALLNGDPGNMVTTIYEDLAGDLWFGGSRGIERLRDGMFTTYSTAEGLPSEINGPVFADSDGRIWFAPISGGLYWLKDGRVGRVAVAGLNDDVVYSISGGNGEIWLGRQHGGLTVLTRSGDSFVARTYTEADGLAQNSVFSVHRNRNGIVWAGTVSGGASMLENGKAVNFSSASGLASNTVYSIVEGYGGTMWFATPNGLNSLTNGVWMDRSASDGLPSADIKCIFEDQNHVLWIATSGGLAFLTNGQIEVPHNLPELLREQIFGIAEDSDGYLWFATSDHVLRVNRDRLRTGTLDDADVQSYGTSDGLQEVEGVPRDRSLVADSLGRIWISLDHSLTVADPRLTQRNSTPVSVRINSVSTDGKQVDLLESPKLAPGSGTITFNYAGTDLATSDRVRFRYRLDGADQRWSDVVASRQVIYKNLGPGPYRFRIVASNNEGLWNGSETDVPFFIEPRFWQTWWFRPAAILAFILTVLLAFRLRTYQLTRQLNARFQERIQERTRIARELHDTLLQSLHGLMFQFQAARNMLPRRPEEAMRTLDDTILETEKALAESRDAIQGLRSEPFAAGNLSDLLTSTSQELAASQAQNQETPVFGLIEEGERHALSEPAKSEVCRIAVEVLRNAFHHASAHRIEAEIRYDDRMLRIRIRDDGKGIDPRVLKEGVAGHWGLRGVRERAERLGAKLDFWSEAGAGTEVQLTVPAAVVYETARNGHGTRSHLKSRNHG